MSSALGAPQRPWLVQWLASWTPPPLRLIVRHRHLLWATTCNDVRGRLAGPALGPAWLLLYPLLLLGAYAAVCLYVFNVRFAPLSVREYPALIFCGLLPFLGFAEALGVGVRSVTGNGHLIQNTRFPADLLPVKAVLAGQGTQLGGTLLLLVALALLGRLTPWAVLAVPVWLCQLALTCGIVWVLGGLNVYLRGLPNVVSALVLVLMVVSPIAYAPAMAPAGVRPFLALNPLYYLLGAYQDCLLFGRPPRAGVLLLLAGVSVGALLLGHRFFRRLMRAFADDL
jgi:lipopolysaccharide transport system permease protein